MAPDETYYEVWLEKLDGRWIQAPNAADGSFVFKSYRDAERTALSFTNDATVMRAVPTERKPIKQFTCAGVHAAKMSLKRKNVHIEGVRIGPNPTPRFLS